MIGGVRAHVFCGPAKVTVRVGGKTSVIRNGRCSRVAGSFFVNIGTQLSPSSPKYSYFGLVVNATRPGTYRTGLVTFNLGTAAHGLSGRGEKVTLKSGLRGGSFLGIDLDTLKPISGSFSC